jgi:predicted TIM-barrel fold metal-dependent hydrolase
MVNVIAIDRILFTADYPYGNMKAARQFLDHSPINTKTGRRSRTVTPNACSGSEPSVGSRPPTTLL